MQKNFQGLVREKEESQIMLEFRVQVARIMKEKKKNENRIENFLGQKL